jgi:hypothetical protein
MRRSTPPEHDPFRDLVVERVERDDGRHLLYYTWPRPAEPQREGETRPPAEKRDV